MIIVIITFNNYSDKRSIDENTFQIHQKPRIEVIKMQVWQNSAIQLSCNIRYPAFRKNEKTVIECCFYID